jgi:hypothetical protein
MITHPELVAKLVKPGLKIKEEITPREIQNTFHILKGAIKISQLLDLYKKRLIYRKEISKEQALQLADEAIVELDEFEASFNEHTPVSEFAEKIKKEITPNQAHLLHMAIGVLGEAGELMDLVFRHVFLGEEIDIEELIKELGDGEFYHEGIRQIFNLLREMILNKNIEKLCTGKNARYKDGAYSDEAAQQRADQTKEFSHVPHPMNQNTGNDFSEVPFTDNETMAP